MSHAIHDRDSILYKNSHRKNEADAIDSLTNHILHYFISGSQNHQLYFLEDENAEKYYGISPYAYCGGDPVNFGDYSGKDATVTITGSDITISACIVLTGSNATEELAKIYQMGIEKEWGAVKMKKQRSNSKYQALNLLKVQL